MSYSKISVILPVYNKQKYLLKILQDIKRQKFEEFECIIVDDGSTDDSGRVSDEFENEDKRFKVIHTQNRGVSHARNEGLMEAHGRYITFIDADDRIDSYYLKNLYTAACNSNADMVIADYEKWWEGKTEHEKSKVPYVGSKKIEELLPEFAAVQKKTGIYGFCWGKLIKAECLYNLRFNEAYVLAEDFEYYLQVYPNINTIYFDNKSCYFYLQRADNSSMIVEDNKIDYLSQLYLNLKYREFLTKMAAYVGENREIVDQLLSDYVFFTVFHSDRSATENCVNQMCYITEKEGITLNGTNMMQKLIFHFLKKNNGKRVKDILCLYDFLRKNLRRR